MACPFFAFSQNEVSKWYFGDYAGISFSGFIPVALTDGALNTGEGCASISSPAGNLEFYTDGRFVYDKNHDQMPNGSGLLGHASSTQSAIIVPKPMSTTQYYIFTLDAYDNGLANGLCYSRVDMTLNGGLGDVVQSEKNISLLPYACEKVSAVKSSNGNSFWVVTHQWGTDAFFAYQVTSSGVDLTPVISNTGPVLTGDMQASKGYIKISPDGTKLAMANNTAYSVGIYNFNNMLGIVAHLVTDNNYSNPGGTDPGGPYGIEYSPDNQRLYVSEWKANRKIYQYDLSSGIAEDILNSRVVVANVSQGADPIGSLQLGPDNKIYVARQNSPYLSRINLPNIQGTGCSFTDNAFGLAGRESNYGLPSFVQSFFKFLSADFYAMPLEGPAPLNVQFMDNSENDPETWKWDFQNDGTYDSFIQNPSFTYNQVGKYTVKLLVQNSSETDSVIKLNYISVGLNCNFSASPTSGQVPVTVQFLDESTDIPTIWKWDFENDGIYDAFIQNPTYTYDEPGEFSVKLFVMNASQTDSLIKEDYITSSPGSTAEGLVAYFPFNGNANDESGNGYHAAVYGASLTLDRFGNSNSAYSFDGVNDYISSDLFYLPVISFSFWYKSPEPDNEWPEFTMYNNLSSQMVGEGQSPYGYIHARKQIMQNLGCEVYSNSAPEFNAWHHVYFEWTESSDLLKLYADGLFQDTGSLTISGDLTGVNNNVIYLGAASDLAPGNFLTGELDDIRIYNRILTEDEIHTLFEESVDLTAEIGIVSVTPEDHNEIIWEKSSSVHIDTFNIYRETMQSNVYEKIGSIPYEDSSMFMDLTCNPQQRPYKYKLSTVSILGNESELSNYHRTIHLTIVQGPIGWNLAWSPYEGFPFETYYIYRGALPDGMNLLDSVSAGFTSFTDIDPPFGPLYYVIEVAREEWCSQGIKGSNNLTRSNVVYNGLIGLAESAVTGILIYPNPAHDFLNFQIDTPPVAIHADIIVFDIYGNDVLNILMDSNKARLDITKFEPGIYLVKVKYNNSIVIKKIVVPL
jgi:PKD repeat protein